MNYSDEQELILKNRVLDILGSHLDGSDFRVGQKHFVMNHLTRVAMIKKGVFYQFWFWVNLSPTDNVKTVDFSFEFSKGIPNTKVLLSGILMTKDENTFKENLVNFIDQEKDQIQLNRFINLGAEAICRTC